MSDRGVSNVTDEKELFKSDPAAQWLERASALGVTCIRLRPTGMERR